MKTCCWEPALTTHIPSVPLVQQKRKKKGFRSIWADTKRKTDSSPLENIIRPPWLCVHKVCLLPSTQTQMSFYCLFGFEWEVSWEHFLLLPFFILSVSVTLQKVSTLVFMCCFDNSYHDFKTAEFEGVCDKMFEFILCSALSDKLMLHSHQPLAVTCRPQSNFGASRQR